MRENCFYCYYHSKCAFLLDVDEWGVCENWQPANIPVRAIEAFEQEFREKAVKAVQHVYNENQKTQLLKYLDMRADSLSAFLSYSRSHELPEARYRDNSRYAQYKKYGGR